jgi:hypothetical protein
MALHDITDTEEGLTHLDAESLSLVGTCYDAAIVAG